MSKTLQLTLKKKYFDLMLSGVKQFEFRKDSQWIRSRLINREYNFIKFTNGYGKDKPFFICKYKGFETIKKNKTYIFDKLDIKVNRGDYIIKLGEIVTFGSIKK